jgi:hypothetical protein
LGKPAKVATKLPLVFTASKLKDLGAARPQQSGQELLQSSVQIIALPTSPSKACHTPFEYLLWWLACTAQPLV